MNCAKSLKLLSEYHDGSLNIIEAARVRMHLMICHSCRGIFHDLELIIAAAAELRDKSPGASPDGKRIRPIIFRSRSHERPST
jgi:predicted anti-sigma-YlaC factor YlaD